MCDALARSVFEGAERSCNELSHRVMPRSEVMTIVRWSANSLVMMQRGEVNALHVYAKSGQMGQGANCTQC